MHTYTLTWANDRGDLDQEVIHGTERMALDRAVIIVSDAWTFVDVSQHTADGMTPVAQVDSTFIDVGARGKTVSFNYAKGAAR